MTSLQDLQAALTTLGIRTYYDPVGAEPMLNVWAVPSDRYAYTTVYHHASRTSGGGFVWGRKFEYGAPDVGAPEHIAAMIAETLQ